MNDMALGATALGGSIEVVLTLIDKFGLDPDTKGFTGRSDGAIKTLICN